MRRNTNTLLTYGRCVYSPSEFATQNALRRLLSILEVFMENLFQFGHRIFQNVFSCSKRGRSKDNDNQSGTGYFFNTGIRLCPQIALLKAMDGKVSYICPSVI